MMSGCDRPLPACGLLYIQNGVFLCGWLGAAWKQRAGYLGNCGRSHFSHCCLTWLSVADRSSVKFPMKQKQLYISMPMQRPCSLMTGKLDDPVHCRGKSRDLDLLFQCFRALLSLVVFVAATQQTRLW